MSAVLTIDAMSDLQVPPWEDLGDCVLQALAETVRLEGWNWVACERGGLALDLRRYGTEPMAEREPTAEELERIAQLQAEHQRLAAAYDANEAERDPLSVVYCAQEQYLGSALDEMQDRIDVAQDALREWTPDQMARLGAVVCLDATGAILVHRGVFRRGEPRPSGASRQRQTMSPRLARDLSAHRTAALQAKVMQCPDAALAILAHRMVETLFELHGAGNDIVRVHLRATTDDTLASDATNYEDSPAGWLLMRAHAEWSDCLPATSDALLRWVLDQDQDTLLALLTYCTARSIHAISSAEHRGGDDSDALARALHLDMADWWMPTADNYLRHVSRREAVAAVREATGQDCTAAVSGMSREEAARYCAAKLEGTRWVPEVLRPQMRACGASEEDERGV